MFKKIAPVCVVVFIRFFALYILIAMLPVYSRTITQNIALIGFIMGGVALTQIFLQLPFSILSDKIGRKNVLYIGSAIIIFGNLFCAYAVVHSDADLLFIGRLIQGASAVSSVLVAIIADLVIEEKRTKAMAFFGVSIGTGTITAMIIGPLLLKADIGMDHVFYILTFLEIINILVTIFLVQNPNTIKYKYNKSSTLMEIVKNKATIYLAITNMIEKFLISFTFLIIPAIALGILDWHKSDLYKVFIPSAIIGLLSTGLSGFLADAKAKPKLVLYIALSAIFIYSLLLRHQTDVTFFITIILFFIGFNMIEPLVQSTASKVVKAHEKARGIAIVNTCGFIGTASGPIIGGIILNMFKDDPATGVSYLGTIISVVLIVWIIVTIVLKTPLVYKTIYIKIKDVKEVSHKHLGRHSFDWFINKTEETLIYKYDPSKHNKKDIEKHIKGK